MNFQDIHSGSDNSDTTSLGHPATSVVLYILSWLFFLLDSFTADEIWTWIWRILSLVSLLLIIFINGSKVKEIIKTKRTKGEE